MSRLGWRAVEVAARLLEPDERDAVLGDLHESGATNWGGLFEVLGLFMRRHAALWSNWRPWLAIVSVSVPSSLMLMGSSVSISLGYLHLIHGKSADVEQISGDTLVGFLTRVIVLIGLAWAGGFAIGSISRKTLWASCTAICFPCLFCLTRFNIEPLSKFCLLLFLPPIVFGIIQGFRGVRVRFNFAVTFTTVIGILVVLTRLGLDPSNWHLKTWIFNVILSWPLGYLVASAEKPSAKGSTLT